MNFVFDTHAISLKILEVVTGLLRECSMDESVLYCYRNSDGHDGAFQNDIRANAILRAKSILQLVRMPRMVG